MNRLPCLEIIFSVKLHNFDGETECSNNKIIRNVDTIQPAGLMRARSRSGWLMAMEYCCRYHPSVLSQLNDGYVRKVRYPSQWDTRLGSAVCICCEP